MSQSNRSQTCLADDVGDSGHPITNVHDTDLSALPSEDEIVSRWGQWSSPVASIVCVVFNQERYVADALRGFLIQETSFPFEIVIGDDNSADGTLSVVQSYQQKYPRLIKILTSDTGNLGALSNGLRTLAAAKGRYIAACEGDDYWKDPHKLEIQVNFLEQNPNYVVSHHNVSVVDGAGKVLEELSIPPWARRDWSSEDMICRRAIHMPTPSLCFRNVQIDYPWELSDLLHGNIGLLYPFISLLGQHGHDKYLGEIEPSVYRRHAGGVWSGRKSIEKAIHQLSTDYLTFRYYQRVQANRYAHVFRERFLDKALEMSLRLAESPQRSTGAARYLRAFERRLLRFLLWIEKKMIKLIMRLVARVERRGQPKT